MQLIKDTDLSTVCSSSPHTGVFFQVHYAPIVDNLVLHAQCQVLAVLILRQDCVRRHGPPSLRSSATSVSNADTKWIQTPVTNTHTTSERDGRCVMCFKEQSKCKVTTL